MIIKILFSHILGYITIKVEGYFIERFINICKVKNISIWNIKRRGEVTLTFNAQIKDFKEICSIARKVKCKVKIKNKKGVPFLLYKYKRRKIFVGLLVIIIFSIIYSSNFVWNI